MQKMNWIIVLLLGLLMLTVIAGCNGNNSSGPAPGTITISTTGSLNLNGHGIYYAIYDTNTKDSTTGMPTGTALGVAVTFVATGHTNLVTISSISGPEDVKFNPGTYYLVGIADLNDSIVAPDYTPDTGDKVINFIPIVVDGNVTKQITEADFTITWP